MINTLNFKRFISHYFISTQSETFVTKLLEKYCATLKMIVNLQRQVLHN